MSTKNKNTSLQAQGTLLVLVSSFFYGTYGIWSRLMGDSFGAYSQAAIKCLLVVLFLLPVAIKTKSLKRFSIRDNANWLIVSMFSSILTAAPIYYAMNKIGIGLSLIIFYAAYLISMQCFDYIQDRRIPNIQEILIIAIAVMGVFLVYDPSIKNFVALGYFAALISGVGTGLNVLSSQKIKANATTTTLTAWTLGIIVNVPIALFLHDTVPAVADVRPWIFIILFAISSILSSWSVISAVKMISTSLAGIIGLTEIVFGIVFGVVLFGETFTAKTVFGSLCIVGAVVAYNLDRKAQKQKEG